MSAPELEGVRRKMVRAYEHLDHMDRRIGAYLDTDPYGVVRHVQPNDPNMLVFALKLQEPPPLDLPLVIGDALHNMRSVLDHLAWQLVLKNHLTPSHDPPRTQFPIYLDEFTAKGNRRTIAIPPGVSPQALALVKSLQPYQRRDDPAGHPLWVLHELSNIDKHRTLNVTTVKMVDSEFRLVNPELGESVEGYSQPGPLHDQAILGVFRIPDGFTLPGYVEVQSQGSQFVAFEEPGPWGERPVQLVLGDICEFLGQVLLPRFDPLFE